MHKLFSITLFFLSTSLFAQNPSSQEILMEARKEVCLLTSRAFAGRGYHENGHQKAANYIARRFKEMGLKEVEKSDKPYQQPFSFPLNVIEKTVVYVNGKYMEAGVDYIPNTTISTCKGRAKIVDAGYGLTDEGLEKSTALVFNDGLPPEIQNDASQKEKYKEVANTAGKMKKLSILDAPTFLIKKTKLTHSFADEQTDIPYFEFLADKLPENPQEIKWEVVANLQEIQSQNVLGMVEGTEVKDKFIVISAHYDHLGKLNNAIFTGANDNASGIAMLLSVAQYFVAHPAKYSILFIAFGGEETGLNGSRYYVENNPIVPLKNMHFLINLDLMGTGEDGIMAVGGVDFPQQFKQLTDINTELSAVPIVKQRKNAPNSDHYFFLANGVKGFFIYTMGGPPWYHDVYDTPQNLEMTKFVDLRALLIRFLAEV